MSPRLLPLQTPNSRTHWDALYNRPTAVPVPAFALRLMLGEFAESLLTGQKALPEVAEKLGYSFRFPTLEPALRSLLQK